MLAAFIKKYTGSALVILFLVFLYELGTDITGRFEPVLFPGLSKILPEFVKSFPILFKGFVSSMLLLVPSYMAALIFGVALGLKVGNSKRLKRIFMPVFRGVSPIPPTMIIPYAIAILPTFWLSSAFIIFLGAFWPILMGTIHGVSMLEQRYIDNARTLELRNKRLLFKVILPGALPSIFSGAGMALIFSFILLTVAEMFGATSGMGHNIQYYADFSDFKKVLAGMIFMTIIIVVIMELFDLIQKKTLYWINTNNGE